jgi:hypothetical protein
MVTKADAWKRLQKLGELERSRDQRLSQEMAIAKALETHEGKRAYAEYLDAAPELPEAESEPQVVPSTKWDLIRKHAGRLRGRDLNRLSLHEQAEAVSDALETPEGRRLYDEYVQELQT